MTSRSREGSLSQLSLCDRRANGRRTVEEAVGRSSSRDARVRAAWAADRGYLLAVAAGMLGRPGEAEDVVQEAFTRLAGASVDDIGDVRG